MKKLLLTALLCLTLVPAGSASALDLNLYGHLSADWWQWIFDPASGNPQAQDGAVNCGVNQRGPIWFLAAGGTGFDGPVVRSCTVPSGKALFFPALNAIWTNSPGENATVAEKRQLLDEFLSDLHPGFVVDLGLPGVRACGVYVTIDGRPATYSHPLVRTQSPPFRVEGGSNPFGIPAGFIEPKAVSDGFWTLLPPLSKGQHTLEFGGAYCGFDSTEIHPVFGGVDVVYHLTVQ